MLSSNISAERSAPSQPTPIVPGPDTAQPGAARESGAPAGNVIAAIPDSPRMLEPVRIVKEALQEAMRGAYNDTIRDAGHALINAASNARKESKSIFDLPPLEVMTEWNPG
jgi:hypothetical protein